MEKQCRHSRRALLKMLGAGAVSAAMTPYLKAVGRSSRKPNIVVLFADDVGYDLMPFLKGQTQKSPRDTFLYFKGRGAPQALRAGPWKLRTVDGVQLYNLDIDPSERYNRAEEKPELVEQLTKRMRQMTEELGVRIK